jgi:AAA15 family ATPase/GTPase
MSSDFIESMKIEEFKCFKNFEADGFKRVNLIGGYNNIGKTTFIEACLLSTFKNISHMYHIILAIQTNRDIINMILNNNSNDTNIQKLIKQNNFKITTNKNLVSFKVENDKYHIQYDKKEYIKTYSELQDTIQSNLEGAKYIFLAEFLSPSVFYNGLSKVLIDTLKKTNKYDKLNDYLQKIFNIYNIDIINDEPHIKKNKEDNYISLSSYGQGFKSFINILLSLLINKEYAFIDEIDGGIHYTLYDKLWEIIFAISKEKNMQIFVTTHSKECISSFNRVQKKLKDKESCYFEMYQNIKNNTLKMRALDEEQLEYELNHNGKFRGE